MRSGAGAGLQQALLGAVAAADLPLQQPQHQPQQQQLRGQGAPGDQGGQALLPLRRRHALGQQLLFVMLQFHDDVADRIAEGHLFDQLALARRIDAFGDLLGQRHAPLQHGGDAADAHQLLRAVADQAGELAQRLPDIVGAPQALPQRIGFHALGHGQRGRLHVADIGLQYVQPGAYRLGMRHPVGRIDAVARKLQQQQRRHHDNQQRGQSQAGEAPAVPALVGESISHPHSSACARYQNRDAHERFPRDARPLAGSARGAAPLRVEPAECMQTGMQALHDSPPE